MVLFFLGVTEEINTKIYYKITIKNPCLNARAFYCDFIIAYKGFSSLSVVVSNSTEV
jgi:hypothetical protein